MRIPVGGASPCTGEPNVRANGDAIGSGSGIPQPRIVALRDFLKTYAGEALDVAVLLAQASGARCIEFSNTLATRAPNSCSHNMTRAQPLTMDV